MPKATLSYRRVASMLARPPDPPALEELLFASKAEAHATAGDELEVEVTPDRLDLLSEGGLGLYLQGVLGESHGLLRPKTVALDPTWEVIADPSVAPRRPEIGALIAQAPGTGGVDEGLLGEAVRFQETLHATVGSDRRLASLGLYPLDRLRPPIRYALEPLGSVSIQPLERDAPIDGTRFLSEHPMGVRYGSLGTQDGQVLTLRDASGGLLSLPPILNARPLGEVRVGDRALLLESTGTRSARVSEALGLLSVVFAALGWSLTPVPVRPAGTQPSGALPLGPRTIPLRSTTLDAIAGRAFAADEVQHGLATARLSGRSVPHGWEVEVPPWRPDLLQEVDLVEEVLLARGLRVEDGVIPPSRSLGGRSRESRFRDRVGELLLGLGYSEVFSPVLVPESAVTRLNRASALRLTNPVSDLFERLRDALELSLIGTLEGNRRSGYPQRFYEVGPVIVAAPRSETGARTAVHAGAILADERAGFAEAASIVDYLTGAVAGVGVREPAELPGTIAGRAARVRLAGEPVAEIGELHPALLAELRVPVPAVWFELDLTALWPLVGRAEAT
jgi:phenylalanyl-tRNA synthetase beta chain